MSNVYHMPTRIVSGVGALESLAATIKGFAAKSVMLVSDPIISRQSWYQRALEQLVAAGLSVLRFEECEIDARVRQIDAQGKRAREQSVDAVISIGGGSVMCAGKGIAIVGANGKSLRDCTGVGNFERRALPMVMVPTTAGSGSEVSQWTVVKDDENHAKLVCGGPLSFPDVAILDPAVLESLPPRIAAATGVDAMTHGLEAYTSSLASPLTDAIALEAIRLQASSLRASICGLRDVNARADNLLASSMANIACGNARLGHAHTLSLPLEGLVDMPHTLGVGVLMPHVLAFNLMVLPAKAPHVARALGVRLHDDCSPQQATDLAVSALRQLYGDIGFPMHWSRDALPKQQVREMAERAVPGLYAGTAGIERFKSMKITDDTVIESLAPRKMTVSQAEAIFTACIA